MKIVINFLLLIITTSSLTNREVTLFDKENSELPENDIWSIGVDSKGNKWIGTAHSGLIKMDSISNMTLFNSHNSPVNGEFISPIFIDFEDNVWISQSKPDAFLMFDGENWHSFSKEQLEAPSISVISIFQSSNKDIYIAGASGVSVFNGETWSRLELPENGGYTCRAIAVSNDGSIAIGHNRGVLIKEKDEWISLTEDNSELQSYVRAVCYVNNDMLYIGYGGNKTGGLSIKNGNEWKHINKSNSGLSDNMVRDIEIDSKGIIWLATNDGLNRIKKDKISPMFFREGVYRNVILDVSTEDDFAWIATNFGVLKVK